MNRYQDRKKNGPPLGLGNTKKSIFEWFNRTKAHFEKSQFVKIYIDYPRHQLINRINKRVDWMFDRGADKVVKFLFPSLIRTLIEIR